VTVTGLDGRERAAATIYVAVLARVSPTGGLRDPPRLMPTPIAVEPLWMQAGEQEPRQAQHAVEELLALASPPTAIFSAITQH
jgi:hypothetical protein